MKASAMRTAVAAFGLLFLATALAQYPTRPIRLLVQVPPGGAPDIAARALGEKLATTLGQPVVVENRPGSNGNIAGELVAKAPADGYILLLGADALITINPHLYAKMPFDPLRDLVPVASVVSNQFVLTVNPALPVKTFQEFIEYARKARPPLAYGSAGHGSQHEMSMEMLKARAGIDLVHVPYKGGGPAATATVSGEVAAMFAGTSNFPLLQSGRLRALAVTGARRSPAFPDLPTIGEFYPGYEVTIWLGLFAPAGTPEAIVARLRADVNKALADPEVKQKLNRAGGLEPYITTPGEFAALIRSDYNKYGKVVKDAGLVVD